MGYEQMCPRYETAIELLGKKWTALLLRILLSGPKRFSEFKLQVPDLSDRLLSERLQELEENGIIVREVHNTRPVLVEYHLTEKGLALQPVVDSIGKWAEHWC